MGEAVKHSSNHFFLSHVLSLCNRKPEVSETVTMSHLQLIVSGLENEHEFSVLLDALPDTCISQHSEIMTASNSRRSMKEY